MQAIFDGRERGILRGYREIRPFFEEGARRRPNALVRWHRTGRWLTDGERPLIWEYPRQAPDGDQVDLVEVMEIADGLIQHHRIYWGWFGTALLTRSAVDKVGRNGLRGKHSLTREAPNNTGLFDRNRTLRRAGGPSLEAEADSICSTL